MPSDTPAPTPTPTPAPARIGYVLKMYPRFSETFIVSEILAREANGERITIFSLRPPIDPRFHPELARVSAPVTYVERPSKPSTLWLALRAASVQHPALAARIGVALPELLAAEVDDAVQAVILAHAVLDAHITHLHAHFASMATTVARLTSLLTGIPFSFTAHAKDLFHRDVDPVDVAAKLRDAHHTITVSDYNVDYLSRLHPAAVERLHLVRNGLELGRFRFRGHQPVPSGRTAGASLHIVAVGRLVEKKGFAILVETAARLRAGGMHLRVSIVGDGEHRALLTAQICELGLEDTVQLFGALPQNDVSAVVAGADVFVAPCIVALDGNADGLPTVILEAMALGVPCIGTDVTGLPEVIRDGDTGVLCGSGSVDELHNALLRVTAPGFDAAGITSRARRLVETEFDSTAQARQLRMLTETSPTTSPAATSSSAPTDPPRSPRKVA
jgi:glycosyltransferase involved in cell wall biosynthesis